MKSAREDREWEREREHIQAGTHSCKESNNSDTIKGLLHFLTKNVITAKALQAYIS